MTHQYAHSDSPLDQDTWQQILTAAKDLFVARGYKGVSMKEIADVVHITHAALYYHFPKGKEDLFTTMIQALFEGVKADQVPLAFPVHNLREQMRRLTADLLTLPLDQLPLLLRDAREHLKDPEHLRIIVSVHEQLKQRVTNLFQAAREAGEMRTDLPVEMLVQVYLGALKEARSSDRLQDPAQLVSALLDGLAGTASHTSP